MSNITKPIDLYVQFYVVFTLLIDLYTDKIVIIWKENVKQ